MKECNFPIERKTKNLKKNPNNMKMTLNTHEVAQELLKDTCACWSRAGAFALAEYLEEYEESTGEEMELDTCAIRCDFSEYESSIAAAEDYGWRREASILDDDDNIRADDEVDDEDNERALQWLKYRTNVIEFDGGVIISQF